MVWVVEKGLPGPPGHRYRSPGNLTFLVLLMDVHSKVMDDDHGRRTEVGGGLRKLAHIRCYFGRAAAGTG
jgi:hypothetical protein